MGKATGNNGDATDTPRAVAKPTATSTRKTGAQSKAKASTKASPAAAASPAAQGAPNEAFPPTSLAVDDQPDEEELLADVSSILDPVVRLSEGEERESDASSSANAAATAVASSSVAVGASSTPNAAELMALQHAEYQRSVELVRQQLAHRHMQQMQQTTQQHLQLQLQQQLFQQQHQQQQQSTGNGSGNMLQQIQQRLKERLQSKSQHPHQQLYDEIRQKAASAAATDTAAKQQLQMQQYHAMIRELEMQAAAAAASTSAGAAAATSSGLSQAEFERMRQDRLQRLHQIQMQKLQQQQQQHQQLQQLQAQHAAALRVTLTSVPPPTSTAEQQLQQHSQMHIDHDRLRLLQQQQQQGQNQNQTSVKSTPTTPAKLLTLEKPPTPQSRKTTPKAAAKKRPSEPETDRKAGAVGATLTTPATAAPTGEAAAAAQAPKKKRKTAAESQMEALVRVLCRLHLSKNESEMRAQLEKLEKWIIKCVDVCLLRFALRDFVETFGVKQKQFEKSPTWPTELLPKCTFTHDKLRHTIVGLDKMKSLPGRMSTATTGSGGQSTASASVAQASKALASASGDAITQAAREHAYAALKEQMMASLLQPKPRAQSAAKTLGTIPTTATAAGLSPVPGVKSSVLTSTIERSSSDSKAVTKKGGLDVTIDATPSKTGEAASKGTANGLALPATTPASPATQTSPKPTVSNPVIRLAPPPMPVNKTISPLVAQQIFDLDLTPRSCAVAPDEGEDRFYFPLKPVSNIMRKVLPGGGPITVRRRRRGRRRAADIENGIEGGAQVKKNEDEEDEDEEVDDGEAENAGDDGDDHEAKAGEDEEDGRGEKERTVQSVGTASTSSASLEPPVKIEDDAVAFMQECVTEFLLFFTSEARDQSTYEKKKGSITGMNLVHALDNLGFAPYARVLANYNDKVRKVQDEEARQKQERKNQAKQRKLRAEQLLKQQQDQQAAGLLMKKELVVERNAATSETTPHAIAATDEPMSLSSSDVPLVAIGQAPEN